MEGIVLHSVTTTTQSYQSHSDGTVGVKSEVNAHFSDPDLTDNVACEGKEGANAKPTDKLKGKILIEKRLASNLYFTLLYSYSFHEGNCSLQSSYYLLTMYIISLTSTQ